MSHTKRRRTLVIGHWSLVITFCLLASLHPCISADDATELKSLVGRFFAAYAKEDLDGVMACWSAKSPQFAEFKQFAQNDFATSDDTQIVNIAFTRWKIETDKAAVRLRFDWKWRDAMTKQSHRETVVWSVQFVREADGWKWWRRSDANEDLATALIAAKTEPERAALLTEEKELVTVELRKSLNRRGLDFHNQGRYPQALTVLRLAQSIAEQIGDKRGVGQALNNMGAVYLSQGNPDLALEFFQKSWKIDEDWATSRGLPGVWATSGLSTKTEATLIWRWSASRRRWRCFRSWRTRQGSQGR